MARDCGLCGDPKAVGKYFVEPAEGCVHGWWRVCNDCAEMVTGQGFVVDFYKKRKAEQGSSLSITQMACTHDWEKHSLVTLEGGYDWMKCRFCDCFGKRFGLGQFGVTELQPRRPISNY